MSEPNPPAEVEYAERVEAQLQVNGPLPGLEPETATSIQGLIQYACGRLEALRAAVGDLKVRTGMPVPSDEAEPEAHMEIVAADPRAGFLGVNVTRLGAQESIPVTLVWRRRESRQWLVVRLGDPSHIGWVTPATSTGRAPCKPPSPS